MYWYNVNKSQTFIVQSPHCIALFVACGVATSVLFKVLQYVDTNYEAKEIN